MHIQDHLNSSNREEAPFEIDYVASPKGDILKIDTRKDTQLIFKKYIEAQHPDLKPMERNVFQITKAKQIQEIFKWAVESNYVSPYDYQRVREAMNFSSLNPAKERTNEAQDVFPPKSSTENVFRRPPLLKSDEKFLDSHRLLKGSSDTEMNPEHTAWTFAYALLNLNREALTPEVQKQLDFLIFQAYSKAAPSKQMIGIGMQVNPQADLLTTYHRFGTSFLFNLNEKFRDDMGFSEKTEVYLIDSFLFKEVLNRSFISYVTIKDQKELEFFIAKHLEDVLDSKAQREVVDISAIMSQDEELFTKTAQIVLEKFNAEHKTNYTLAQLKNLCPVAFSEHKEEKVLLLPAAAKMNSVYLTNLLHTTGFYLSPDRARKAFLKINTLSSAVPQQGILATAGSTIPVVFAHVKEFAANNILKQFGALANDQSLSLHVRLQAKATAKIVAGLADLDIDKACAEKNLTPLLQIAYVVLKNSMHMAMLNKDDFVAFNNEIELMHQVLQSILEVAQPYQAGSLEASTIAGLKKSHILPAEINPPKVHLKASAMHSLSSILASVEQQKETTKLNVAHIKGSYYETGGALSKYQGGLHYEASILDENIFNNNKEKALAELKNLPLDVFVCEFHYNFQNRKMEYSPIKVKEQVIELLKRNSGVPLTVVIDHTIGLEHSDELRELLAEASLQEAIESGKLNLVLLRSAQKYDMLGQDNYYGGITTTFNNSKAFKLFNARMDDPADQLEGFNYQGLTHIHICAQQEVDEYRKAVMDNTHKLYNSLLSKGVKVGHALDEERGVVKVAEINDKNTPFLHIEGMSKSAFMQFAKANGLPLTDRLSFGFANTNITEVSSYVRLNVGLEAEDVIEKYAEFIAEAQKKSLEPAPPRSFNYGRAFSSNEDYDSSYSGEYDGSYSDEDGSGYSGNYNSSYSSEGSSSHESVEDNSDANLRSNRSKSTKSQSSEDTGTESGE